MQRVTGYWKRFAGLVTDSAHKYRYDPFFRTEVTIVVLQFAFATFLLLVVGVIATQLYHDVSVAVAEGINTALTPHSTPAVIGSSVIEDLSAMRSRTVMFAAGAIIVATAIFTYIMTRIALSPTRNALASQKQFIGNVAHELRTPLAVSKTNLEVALMTPTLDESLKNSLVGTVEELDRASEIINNLLSLSASIRPERIEFSDVDLGTVVRGIMRNLHGLSESKHLELEARMSERRIVWGNTTALEQIVMNVIKNAISYTSDRGRILITMEPVHPDFIEFTVQDSGRGIAHKDLFRIFEPYYRADPSRKRDGGSGLGLTIVSELIKLHNGRISVRSAEGRGTTVTILFPAGKQKVGISKNADPEHDNASEIAVDFSHSNRGI
jgi:two-component system sensor histidine kinase CiaH